MILLLFRTLLRKMLFLIDSPLVNMYNITVKFKIGG